MKLKRMIFSMLVIQLITAGASLSCKKELTVKMATTTSTDNTGLLDYLKPYIVKDTGIDLKWVAVGTGKALEFGRNCDVDILLVHAPGAEKKFIARGFGINRREIMYNDFIIIGPENDPAAIKGKSPEEAFKLIASKKSYFASRGDNSGTNKKEISIWKAAGLPVPDRQSWYLQTGQGMINTINIAAEQGAYTLTDRGTYIKYTSNKEKAPLIILSEKHKILNNQYSIIEVNPSRCSEIKSDLSKKISSWFVSPEAQKLIGAFRLSGKRLFTPNAKKI